MPIVTGEIKSTLFETPVTALIHIAHLNLELRVCGKLTAVLVDDDEAL